MAQVRYFGRYLRHSIAYNADLRRRTPNFFRTCAITAPRDGIVKGPSVLSQGYIGSFLSYPPRDGIVEGPSVLSRREKRLRKGKTPCDGTVEDLSVLSRGVG